MKQIVKKNILHYLERAFWQCLNAFLSIFETVYLAGFCDTGENHFFYPPVFIIGAPRSGTTLLYQLLVNRYKFVYFSNFTANFYKAPIFAAWLCKKSYHRTFGDKYTSHHGLIKGRRGPHEAGDFWYRWFPRGKHVYVGADVTSRSKLKKLRQEVVGMSKVTGLPAIFKNTFNAMRIAPIAEAFPEVCFIVCHRDPVDCAQSILNARIKRFGSKEIWWSLPPKEINTIERHPYWEQVVEQVFYTNKQILADRQQFGDKNFYDVHYKDLCKNTHGVLDDIERFLVARKLDLKRHDGDVPAHFSYSTGKQSSDEDYQHIIRKVRELWG